ncbi:MAG: hypothetical protein KDD47_26095, partial [Acidobacteria bacterium]|nr:hypothetical protein [Acidobacteriota bacterium]
PTRLVPERGTLSVWVSDGATLLRLTAAGQVQESLELGAVELRDLAGGPLAPDAQGPTLVLTSPTDGATVDAESFEVELSWSDAGAGVDASSFLLLLDGVDAPADCTKSFSGAVCTVTDLWGGIHTLSAEVADYLGNPSLPAQSSVVVESVEEPPGEEPADDPDSPPGDNDPEPYRFVQPERGLNANRVYLSDEDIETISTSTGNLTLTIPLGQLYTVGPLLSYQLQLVHNAQAWQRVTLACRVGEVPCPPGAPLGTTVTMTVPNPTSNAGLGWSLHFGRLFASAPPTGLTGLELELWPNRAQESDPTAEWLYEAPDGSQYTFHRKLQGRPEDSGRVLYTKDGSHMRLRRVGNEITISEP